MQRRPDDLSTGVFHQKNTADMATVTVTMEEIDAAGQESHGVVIPEKAPASEESSRHYNDWPNTQGVSVSSFR